MTVFELALMGMTLGGCTSSTPPPLPADTIATRSDAVYRLGLGDKVRINVFGEPALSGEYQVSGNGAVTMPLIGDVPAVGLSTHELEAALLQRYAGGYLKSPKIVAQVYDFRPYFIYGEVQKPGRYPSTEDATLLGAIVTAGGFTYRANSKRVFIRRAGEATEHSVEVSSNIRIAPGDVVRVGERYF